MWLCRRVAVPSRTHTDATWAVATTHDVRFEDTHWSVVPRQNMSPSGRRMTAEEVEEMERLQAAVTHLKVKFRAEIKFLRCAYPPRYRRDTGQVRPHQQGPGLQGEVHAEREPLEVL